MEISAHQLFLINPPAVIPKAGWLDSVQLKLPYAAGTYSSLATGKRNEAVRVASSKYYFLQQRLWQGAEAFIKATVSLLMLGQGGEVQGEMYTVYYGLGLIMRG